MKTYLPLLFSLQSLWKHSLTVLFAVTIVTSGRAQAQVDQPDLYDIGAEFAFVRIQYDSYYGSGYYGGTWLTDFPADDENFLRGVARLTNLRVMSQPKVLRFDDEEIFDYPFLYALEMGRNGGLSRHPAKPRIYVNIYFVAASC